MSDQAVPNPNSDGERSPEAAAAEDIIDTMRDPILVLDGVSPWGSLDGDLMVLTPPLAGYRRVHA